jgi:hypothetical protein
VTKLVARLNRDSFWEHESSDMCRTAQTLLQHTSCAVTCGPYCQRIVTLPKGVAPWVVTSGKRRRWVSLQHPTRATTSVEVSRTLIMKDNIDLQPSGSMSPSTSYCSRYAVALNKGICNLRTGFSVKKRIYELLLDTCLVLNRSAVSQSVGSRLQG